MESLSALLAFCEGNPTVTSGSPNKGSVMQGFEISFVKRLNTQSSWSDLRRHGTHVAFDKSYGYLTGTGVIIMWFPKMTADKILFSIFKLHGDEDIRLILGLRPASERRHYFVTTSLTGWVQTWNQPWGYSEYTWEFIWQILLAFSTHMTDFAGLFGIKKINKIGKNWMERRQTTPTPPRPLTTWVV